MNADDFLDDPTGALSVDEFLGDEPPRPITTGRSTITDPKRYEPQQRRGGTRSEARPYVASETGSGAGSAEFAAIDPRRTDSPREPVRPLTMRQAKDDLLGGVEQVKALGEGVKAYGGAVDWRGASLALADLEGIEAGRPPMAQEQLLPSGRRVPGEPSPLAREYMASGPAKRESMRNSLSQALQRDEGFIANSIEAIKGYQAEQQRLSGRMPDFTDARTLADLGRWAVRNGLAASPSMAVTMVAAVAGGVPGALAAGGGMAIGDLTQNRAEFAERTSDPARFTNPDRRDAATASRNRQMAQHLANNVGETAALAIPYAAADMLGPEGALARKGVQAAAKSGIAHQVAGEAFGEGAQEVVNVAGEMLAGERRNEVTTDDVKRVVNAAAVGGVMGGAGHAATVAGAKVQDMARTRSLTAAAEGGDLASALELVARERGLPPVTPVAMPERLEQPRQAADQTPVKKPAPSVEPAAAPVSAAPDQIPVKEAASSVLDQMGVTRVDNGQRARPQRDADFGDLADEIGQLETAAGFSPKDELVEGVAPGAAAPSAQAVAPAAPAAPAAQAEPDSIWTGRRGDGYATEAEATVQLPRRQRAVPGLDWTAEPRADGRWQLVGRRPVEATTDGATTTDPVRDGGDGAGQAGAAAAPAAAPTRSALDDIIERFDGERTRISADIDAAKASADLKDGPTPTVRATQLRLMQRQLDSIPNVQRPEKPSRSFEVLADAVESITGRRPVAYVDTSASAGDGFTDGNTAFVNLANPHRSVAFTAFHEHQHIVRQMAQGGDRQAQLATRMLDQVWGMIDEEGKRRYAEKYLFRAQFKAGAMTAEEALASPLLKDEMLSDFMGKRADDVEFWRGLARKDPKSFGGFAARWIDTLKQLIRALRGKARESDVKDVDTMIADLERAKLVAERVLKSWAGMNPRAAEAQGISAEMEKAAPENDLPAPKVAAPTSAEKSRRNSARKDDEYDAFNVDRMLDEDVDETVTMDDLDKLDGDVEHVPAGESRELSDEEMAELQAELADASVPAVQRVRAPDDDMLKAAGIMAEAVYSDFEYVRDGGDQRSATITFDGRREHVFQLRASGGTAGTVSASPSQLVGAGSPLTLFGATDEGARAYNKRMAASIDLYLRKFDLYTAISAPARRRVAEAWEEISQLSGAFEFDKAGRADDGDRLQLLQRIAEEMLADSRWTAHAGPAETARRGWSLKLNDAKAGLAASADIEYRGGAEPKLVMHTIDFTPSSGMGKPFYQVAFAFGDAIRVPTIADPNGLTGINTYRRTEQMMSAAARAGRAGAVSPGLGQRIYGWNPRAKDDEQRQRNFVRIALAGARNAAELAPKVRDMAYDMGTDTFSWRRGKGQAQEAEAYVQQVLADRDARAVGISRSTLARAAVTFAAIDGRLDLGSVRKVAKPILYSAREEVTDIDARSRFDGVKVQQQIRIAETGQVATLTLDAGATLRELDQRAETYHRVIACLASKGLGICMKLVARMSDADQDDLVERVDTYLAAGMAPADAQRIAAGDLLAEVEAERAEIEGLATAATAPAAAPGATSAAPAEPPAPPEAPEPSPEILAVLRAAVNGAKANAGAPGYWRALLERAEVEPEELASTGIEAWLGQRKGKVWKVDLLERLGGKDAGSASTPSAEVLPAAPQPPAEIRASARGTWNVPAPTFTDKVIYQLQDKQVDLKRVGAAISEAVGALRDRQDGYLREELFHGRVADRTQRFLENEVRPLMTEMRAAGVTLDELELYLHARHAPERNAAMMAINEGLLDNEALSGMTDTEAATIVAAASPAVQRLAARVDAITAGTRDLLEVSGLETPETVDALRDAYAHYVPLHRDEAHADSKQMIGSGFSVRGTNLKRAVGSKARVTNILAHIVEQREATIVRAEKNLVAMAVYAMALRAPNPDFWTVDTAPKTRKLNETSGQVETATVANFKARDNVLVVKVNGEERFVIFNERDDRAARMGRALKNLDVDTLDPISGFFAQGTRWLASVNTQYNPVFAVTNGIRDIQSAVVNLASTPIAGKQVQVVSDAVRHAYGAVWRAERDPQATGPWVDLYRELGERGGLTGWRDSFSGIAERAQALKNEIASLGDGPVRRGSRAVLDLVGDFNTAIENGVRVAAYKAALDAGLSKDRAASLAKNLTVNFNRKGRLGRMAGAWYAFFNAAVQGTARLAETLASPAGRWIIAGGIGLGVLQAAALQFGLDDDDRDNLQDWEKEKNLIIPVRGSDGKYVKIPMALGLHILPNIGRHLGEMAFAAADGQRMQATKHLTRLVGSLLEALNPVGGGGEPAQAIAPSVADPIVQLGQNKDFAGKPIYRERGEYSDFKSGDSLARDSTSPVYKAMSRWINRITGGEDGVRNADLEGVAGSVASPQPEAIRFIVETIGGGVWRESEKLIEAMIAGAKGTEVEPHRLPLVGRFYGDLSGPSAPTSKFYENQAAVQVAKQALKRAQEAGDDMAVDRLSKQPELELVDRAARLRREIAKLRERRREAAIEGAPEVELRGLDKEIGDSMREFNAEARDVMR